MNIPIWAIIIFVLFCGGILWLIAEAVIFMLMLWKHLISMGEKDD
jgi:hypothetical protein